MTDWTAVPAIPADTSKIVGPHLAVGAAHQPSGNLAQPSSLTPAELAVMRLSARGLATKEVAHRLGIRFGTVRRHRQNAYGKVGASSLAGALWAMGWVRLP